jgi:hypothetical protein
MMVFVGVGSRAYPKSFLGQKRGDCPYNTAVSSAMQYILIPLNPPIEGGLSLSPPWEGGLSLFPPCEGGLSLSPPWEGGLGGI